MGPNLGRHPFSVYVCVPVILGLAVSFNFGLCALHTLFRPVSTFQVIIVEAVLIGTAATIGFWRPGVLTRPWLIVLLCQLILLLSLSLLRDELLLKPIRDALLVPVFIVLGLSAQRFELGRFLLVTNIVVLSVALLELSFLQHYLGTCNVTDYFASKGFDQSGPIRDEGLFASGIRPNGRFLFDLPGDHRISSLFLEPVSLGFFGLITGFIFLAFGNELRNRIFVAGVLTSALVILLADGRMALGLFLVCTTAKPLLSRLDARSAAFFFPMVASLAWFLVEMGVGSHSGEGTIARLASTLEVISQVNLSVASGLGGLDIRQTVDTGFVYLLETQGLAGTMLYWLAPLLIHPTKRGSARTYTFFLALYISAGFMLSAAFFTIKTAAILWFAYGYFIARDAKDNQFSSLSRSEFQSGQSYPVVGR